MNITITIIRNEVKGIQKKKKITVTHTSASAVVIVVQLFFRSFMLKHWATKSLVNYILKSLDKNIFGGLKEPKNSGRSFYGHRKKHQVAVRLLLI